ncbi:MAG: SAM-dependent methyltransferase [Actinobacteria bacterium]|nr:MAG: SAM-dependent methyltransferase [Actinomycetota bacterium]
MTDNTKQQEAIKLIKDFCLPTSSTNLFEMANELMKLPNIPMISAHHHPMIAAIIVTAYKNKTGELQEDDIVKAIKRGASIPAGFCAFYGSDGAALACGIALSIILKTTHLADKDRQRSLTHMLTSRSLAAIANNVGNRCCKRSTFDVLNTVNQYLREVLSVELETTYPASQKCRFSNNFELCNKQSCRYYLEEA